MAKRKETRTVKMSVKEYIAKYKEVRGEVLTRHDVYALIKKGALKAEKGPRGAWIISVVTEVEVKEDKKPSKGTKKASKTYTTKEFVAAYNEKHKKHPITVVELRQMIELGTVKAKKVAGKWVISQSPSRCIK